MLLENARTAAARRINNIAFIVGESEVIVNIFEAPKSVGRRRRARFIGKQLLKRVSLCAMPEL